MRKLNNRQKRILDERWAIGERDIYDLAPSAWKELKEINDNELLHQNAGRYLMDKTLHQVHIVERSL